MRRRTFFQTLVGGVAAIAALWIEPRAEELETSEGPFDLYGAPWTLGDIKIQDFSIPKGATLLRVEVDLRTGRTRPIFAAIAVLILAGSLAAQNTPTPTYSTVTQSSSAASAAPKESKKARKRNEKMEKARERERATQEAWEEVTRPPEPAYPGSITPDFARAAAQATIVIDNAFNSMSKSRFEFAVANQSSIQYAAGLAVLAHNDGERQVSAILYHYSQKIPVCQEAAWEALQNVLTLIAEGGGVRACTNDLRRLRAQADRTFDRNR